MKERVRFVLLCSLFLVASLIPVSSAMVSHEASQVNIPGGTLADLFSGGAEICTSDDFVGGVCGESDPQVGAVADGKLCVGVGTQVVCNQDASAGVDLSTWSSYAALTDVNVNDKEVTNVHALQLKDWDDDTGGAGGKYRVLARDGAWMFDNGGVVVGDYPDGTWDDLADGTLIVEGIVGVGDANPSYGLTLGTGKQIKFADEPGNKIYFHGSSYKMGVDSGILYYDSYGVHSFRFRGTERVSIGSDVVTVGGSGSAPNSGDLRVNGRIAAGERNTGAGTYNTIAYAFGESRGFGYNAKDDTMFYNSAGPVPFIIRGNGNVGIGTTGPEAKLDVAGSVRAQSLEISGSVFLDDLESQTASVTWGSSAVESPFPGTISAAFCALSNVRISGDGNCQCAVQEGTYHNWYLTAIRREASGRSCSATCEMRCFG